MTVTVTQAKALVMALQDPEGARAILGPYGCLAADVAAVVRERPRAMETGLRLHGTSPEAIMRWLSERVSSRITAAYERRQDEIWTVRARREALRAEIARRDAAVRRIRTAWEIMADLGRPEYGIKYPGQPWSATRWVGSIRETVSRIEGGHQPGYTARPYVQLVHRDLSSGGRLHVVAEWEPSRRQWTDPLIAAGFLPRSV